MRSNTKKRIGRIALGMIFLLNPNVNIVDLLPDFIGCVLVLSGLASLRDISDSLEDARRNFLRLFWVSLSHLPAFVLMIIISSNYVSEKTSILVFAFVYSVLEFILINNALTSLIDGLVYIGERYDGDCCFYETKKNGKRLDVGKLRFATTVFLLITKGLTVAPTLVYLFDTSIGYGMIMNPYARNPVEYIGPLTAICFIPGLVVGIMWARRIWRYIKGIAKDEEFVLKIDTLLSDRSVQNTSVYKYRRVSTAVYVLFAATVLCMDMYINEFNIFHDVISAFVFLGAAIFMKKRFKEASGVTVTVCSVYAAAQTAMFSLAWYFNSHFKFSDVGRVEESDMVYLFYVVLLCVCEILFVCVFALTVRTYTKVLCGGFSMAVREGHKKAGKDVFLTDMKKKNLISVGLAALTGVCHVIYIYSMGDMRRVKIVENDFTSAKSTYLPALEGFWMVQFAVNLVFIVFFLYNLTKSREELRDRLYILQ